MFHKTPAPTVSVDLSTRAVTTAPVEVTTQHPVGNVIHISAADLSEAQTLRHRIRADQVVAGQDPDATSVVLDIDVHIAVDARTARKELASAAPQPSRSVQYVGTAAGLAGLIADVKAADVADGVTIHPILESSADRSAVVTRIVDGVLPWLAERGVSSDSVAVDALLRRVGADGPAHTLAS